MVVLVFIVVLAVDAVIASGFSKIADEKGYESSTYWWYCFLFSAAGYLMVVALPDRNRERQSVVVHNAPAPAEPQLLSDELPDL